MTRWGALLTAELRKVTTTKLAGVLTLVALLLAAVAVIPNVLVASGTIPSQGTTGLEGRLTDPDYISVLLSNVSLAAMLAMILGVIAMAGEYRHKTITSTFLAEPRRGRVVTAKLIVYAALGAVMALVVVLAVAAATIATMIPFDHAPVTATMVGRVLLGAVIGFALYAVLGVSVGSLLRNQVAAIIAVVVWSLLLEPLLSGFFPAVGKWLPGGALTATMGVGLRVDVSGGRSSADYLPVWAAMGLLLLYAAVFAAIASRTTIRRDIT